MNRSSWSSGKEGRLKLGDKQPSEFDTPKRHLPVPKAALEDGILHLLATAAEMQQRQDLESANQLYEAAIAKMKAHGLDRKKFLAGTAKKPAPLNSKTPVEWSIHVGDMKSVITLLGDPNIALSQLISNLNFEQIEGLLAAGASIEHRLGPHGRTLLLREAAEGRARGVELALDHGASVSCMDDIGDTALALALKVTSTGAVSIVTALLKAGADINLTDGEGQPVLRVAAAHSTPETVAKVVDALSPLTAKHHQQMEEYVASLPFDGRKLSERTCGVIRMLLQSGLDPNSRRLPRGNPGLFELVLRQGGDDGVLVANLIEHEAEPNLETALQYGQMHSLELVLTKLTPLSETNHIQIAQWVQSVLTGGKKLSQRNADVLKILLDFGLDPDLRSEKPPHSPLIICAAEGGNSSLVERLITHKAKLTASNDNSDTALVCAAKSQNRAVYDALKAGGVNDKYFLGWTVWSNYSHN